MDALNVKLYAAYKHEGLIIQQAHNAVFFSMELDQHYVCMYSFDEETMYVEPDYADCFDGVQIMEFIMELIENLNEFESIEMDDKAMQKQRRLLRDIKNKFMR